jgi:hypothetical protein
LPNGEQKIQVSDAEASSAQTQQKLIKDILLVLKIIKKPND